ISVNDDYIDPVDHVLNASLHHHHHHHDPPDVKTGAWSASSASGDTSSGSRKSGVTSEATSTSTHGSGETGSVIEPPYHEIRENYNAPYYYSDTIKEPTYVTPCENEGVESPSGTNSISDTSSPSPTFPEPVTVTVININAEEVGDERQFTSSSQRVPGLRKHTKLNRRSAYLRGANRKLMARKRYETAFLPSSTPHSSSQSTPDIDSLVLAIESSCQLGHDYVSKTDISQQKAAKNFRSCFQDSADTASGPQRENKFVERSGDQNKGQDAGVERRIIAISHPPNNTSSLETVESKLVQRDELHSSPLPPTCFPETTVISSSNFLPQTSVSYCRTSNLESTDVGSHASLQTNPSMSLCQQGQSHLFQHHYYPHHVHQNLNLNLHASRNSGLCTTTNSSPLATHKKPVMPLSEPLPQKRYITKSISSSGHNTTSSSSSSDPGETRRLGHNLKDTSVSSLESIDSMKSEDLPASLNRQPVNFYNSHHSSHYYPQKLLSPISDKSPLEPAGVLTSSHQTTFDDGNQQVKHDGSKWPNQIGLLNHSELTNVPWEMPKLRRKLAKLADSGISLDFAGSGSKETECGASSQPHYAGGMGARASMDLGLGASNTQHGITQGQSSYNKREMGATTLQLSFDDGLTRDEYYEDPHYTLHEGHTFESSYGSSRHGFLTASKIPGSAIMEDVTVQVHVSQQHEKPSAASIKPDRCRMKLDFSSTGFGLFQNPANVIDPTIELERQDWFHGAITRCEAENILRATKEGSFLVRNCESTTFNRYSLSLKSFRGCIHIRIEPNSLGTFSLGDQEFPSVPHLVLHFMSHRLPIKGAEHVRLMYPVITQLL
ncbi:SH2 domain-containing adapter protein F, partial [Orchesella cincta]